MALALMRRHRRWLYVFLWLVIAAFIILYIPAFQQEQSGTPGETIVSVGKLPISVGEFQRSYYRQRQVYDRLYQGRLEEPMLRQIQQRTLESLVAERLVELEAKRLGISVSDEAVARAIATSPEFQDEGRYIGSDEIRRRLDLQGMTEEQLAESLRRQLLSESLQNLVGSVADASDAEVERELARRNEQVKLEYVLADAARFRAAVQPSEQQIQARFEAKQDAYKVPEKRVVSYVLLDHEVLRPQAVVKDRDIERYYEDHREEYRQEEEACARHILVKVKQGDAAEGHTDEEARQIVEGLLAQVSAGGDLAAIARKFSEDLGSAQNGGDLGCFPPGRMVREFDDAVFALQPGETSPLVKSSFGYHIIRLESKRESTVLPLAQVKERIRATVLERKLGELGDEKAQAVSDALTRGKSLEEAAKVQGLSVRKSAAFARGETPPVVSSPMLVARVFALKQGEVEKEAYPLPQGAAFFALAEIVPAHPPKLEEVHDKVRDDIVLETAFEQARSLAASLKAKAETAGLDKAAAAAGLVRKETPPLTGRGQPLGELGTGLVLDEVAFSLPEKTLSDPVRTASGWAVLRVLEKKTADPAKLGREREQVGASLREQKRSELFRAFLLEARERYQITRNPKAYQRAVGEQQ
jgi:peptidyl-prolyl cis-trans isomerase D